MLVGYLPSARHTSSSSSSKSRTPRSSSSRSSSSPEEGMGVGVLRGVLQACNLARREMVHFVTNLSSFMMFEVGTTTTAAAAGLFCVSREGRGGEGWGWGVR